MSAVMTSSCMRVCVPTAASRNASNNARTTAIRSVGKSLRTTFRSSVFSTGSVKLMSKAIQQSSISKKSVVVRAAVEEGELDVFPSQKILILGYLATLLYTVQWAPQGTSELDAQLVADIFTKGPFSPEVNPLFFTQFNAIGVIPAIYAALLAPGDDEDQLVPQLPFTVVSLFLGFFALGPYLFLRKTRTEVASIEDQGFLAKYFEQPANKIVIFAWAALVAGYCAVSLVQGGGDVITNYIELFQTDQLVNVSLLDCAILSFLVYGPIAEDMERRGVDTSKAIAYSAVPLMGPALYYLTRPDLE